MTTAAPPTTRTDTPWSPHDQAPPRYMSCGDANGHPDISPQYDEDGGPIPGTLGAGWDVSFGCRINFAPDPDGHLQVCVNVSDRAQRDGIATRPVTPTDLRTLAWYLHRVATDHENRAGITHGTH